jgi:prepilin-type N-terminal cleavage/methylation domain-containing protein
MQSNKVVKSYARANLSTMYSRRARNGNSAGGSCKQRMGLPRVTRVAGFTLLELMIVAAIMVVVMAVVMRGIIEMQHRNAAESSKVDTVQQSRDFIDQMVRDIHDVGYR